MQSSPSNPHIPKTVCNCESRPDHTHPTFDDDRSLRKNGLRPRSGPPSRSKHTSYSKVFLYAHRTRSRPSNLPTGSSRAQSCPIGRQRCTAALLGGVHDKYKRAQPPSTTKPLPDNKTQSDQSLDIHFSPAAGFRPPEPARGCEKSEKMHCQTAIARRSCVAILTNMQP